MNIREIHPVDPLGRKRTDIIEYYHIDKHIATLVIPRMVLSINGDKSYRVKDYEDVSNHIKKYYFKED